MLFIAYQVYKRCCMQPQPHEAQDHVQLAPPPPPIPPLPRTDFHSTGDIFGIPFCPICLDDYVEVGT